MIYKNKSSNKAYEGNKNFLKKIKKERKKEKNSKSNKLF
jgi:hypothetical protein